MSLWSSNLIISIWSLRIILKSFNLQIYANTHRVAVCECKSGLPRSGFIFDYDRLLLTSLRRPEWVVKTLPNGQMIRQCIISLYQYVMVELKYEKQSSTESNTNIIRIWFASDPNHSASNCLGPYSHSIDYNASKPNTNIKDAIGLCEFRYIFASALHKNECFAELWHILHLDKSGYGRRETHTPIIPVMTQCR